MSSSDVSTCKLSVFRFNPNSDFVLVVGAGLFGVDSVAEMLDSSNGVLDSGVSITNSLGCVGVSFTVVGTC